MTDTATRHAEQIEYWNGPGGTQWAAHQARTDRVMAEIAGRLIDAAAPHTGEIAIDIGCGSGQTTAALADRVGAGGKVLALDVSAPLLDSARERLAGRTNVTFALADAAVAPLAGVAADLLVSRFGVMFFGDPVAAFVNLRTGLRPGGRMAFACWRAAAENPWMMVPLHAVYRHVPPLPQQAPTDPGPYAFADPDHVRGILGAAGFMDVAIEPLDLALDLACGEGLDGAIAFVLQIGPASRALQGQPAAARAAAETSVREALTPYLDGGAIRLPAAIWIVSATA